MLAKYNRSYLPLFKDDFFNDFFSGTYNGDKYVSTPAVNIIEENDEFHISTERRLLYTCMTRARNKLFLFSSDKNNPSRYLKEIDVDLLDDISPKNFSKTIYDDDLPF